jgi:hypothetical protein
MFQQIPAVELPVPVRNKADNLSLLIKRKHSRSAYPPVVHVTFAELAPASSQWR